MCLFQLNNRALPVWVDISGQWYAEPFLSFSGKQLIRSKVFASVSPFMPSQIRGALSRVECARKLESIGPAEGGAPNRSLLVRKDCLWRAPLR